MAVMTKQDLLNLIGSMGDGINDGDSFEGRLSYTYLGAEEFEVDAAIRIDNSLGQGGMILIQPTWDKCDASPILEDWELDLQTNMEIARDEMRRVMEEEDAT